MAGIVSQDKRNAMTTIYGLVDPAIGIVRYIGKSNNPQVRLRCHVRDARIGRTDHKSRWVASILREGRRPSLIVIEVCDYSVWKDREQYWITHFRTTNDLCNAKDGGDGFDPDAQCREKMSAAKRGRPAHNRGVSPSEETRIKQSEAAKRRFSCMSGDERRAYTAPAYLAQNINGQHHKSGWRHTEEARQKIREAARFERPARRLLSDDQAINVWILAHSGKMSQREIANQFGISPTTVSQIKYNKQYKHVARPETHEALTKAAD